MQVSTNCDLAFYKASHVIAIFYYYALFDEQYNHKKRQNSFTCRY